MSADDANIQTLADLLADPKIRAIWERELWEAFADPAIRQRFEQETGLHQQQASDDPLHSFTDEAEREGDAYAFAFMHWFNERCWPELSLKN